MKYVVQEGSHSIAEVVALCRPELISAFPITPQTHIVEKLAELVSNGKIDAEFVNVESEHSAISVITGAEACGMRTFSATSSQGLALMHEVLHAVSGMRLPIVMVIANRALSAPLNIWNDQSDSMAQRDTSWLQLYAESVQEAVDLIAQAYRVAESGDVMLPVMVCMDGYVLTHIYEPTLIPEQAKIDEFLPPFKPEYILDPEKPMTFGAYATPNDYMEFKWEQQKAMENAKRHIVQINTEYKELIGRGYGNGLIELYHMENAKIAIVAIGSICGTLKEAIDRMEDVGLVRIRAYRPFPAEELRDAFRDIEIVAVIDRAFSYGCEGPVFSEVRSALYTLKDRPLMCNFIVGLGGRDTRVGDIFELVKKAKESSEGEVTWFNLKA